MDNSISFTKRISKCLIMDFDQKEKEENYRSETKYILKYLIAVLAVVDVIFFIRALYYTIFPDCEKARIIIRLACFGICVLITAHIIRLFLKERYQQNMNTLIFIEMQIINFVMHFIGNTCDQTIGLYAISSFNCFVFFFSVAIKISWLKAGVLYWTISLYSFFQFNQSRLNLSWIVPCFITLFMFLYEKSNRDIFSQLYDTRIENEQYKIIMNEHIDSPIFLYNHKDKEILFCNVRANQLLRYFCEKFDNLENMFSYFFNKSRSSNQEELEIQTENETLSFRLNSKTLKWINSKTVQLYFFICINGEKLIKRVSEETVRFKELMIATVSHDLRTPLNSSLNFLQICIANKNMPPELKKMILNAYEANKILLAIINDLIDLHQINNSNFSFNLSNFYLEELKDTLEIVFNNSMKEKGLNFMIIIPENVSVNSDCQRIERVLINLISNAQKFTRFGTIVVRMLVNIEKSCVLFEVEDTGRGLKEEEFIEINKLINSQKTELSARNDHGYCLGLSIASLILKKLNPEGLKFESEFEKGSKFFFSIPYSSTQNLQRLTRITNRLSSVISNNDDSPFLVRHENVLSSLKVLVIEDEQTNVSAMEAILGLLKMDGIYAYNGMEALDILKRKEEEGFYFDLILSDINMPVMDGYQFALSFQEWNNEYFKSVVMIACTANAGNAKKKILEHGFGYYLSKPVSQRALKNILEAIYK